MIAQDTVNPELLRSASIISFDLVIYGINLRQLGQLHVTTTRELEIALQQEYPLQNSHKPLSIVTNKIRSCHSKERWSCSIVTN